MTTQTNLGGRFALPGTSMNLNRMGYGAMQLAGPQVYGPPRDRNAAIAVLREAPAAAGNNYESQLNFTGALKRRPKHESSLPQCGGRELFLFGYLNG